MIRLFLSPSGTINRTWFLIGFIGLCGLIMGGNLALSFLSGSMAGFLLSLFLVVFWFYVIYCVYGKRLHDLGRSLWMLTGLIALECLMIIFVMLAFGGAEYFAEFSQYDRKAVIEPEVKAAITEKYQTALKANLPLIQALMLIIPVGFTAILALLPGKTVKFK